MDGNPNPSASGATLPQLVQALDLGQWLPAELGRYRRLIGEAVAYFLGQLPDHRQEEILVDQASLPWDTPLEARLVTLLRRCPTLHKLGQVVARDRRLLPALRAQLQQLETLPATLSLAQLRPLIRAELGEVAGLELVGAPLAEASVAIVTRFRLRSDTATLDGVLKLLKPGIESRLAEDLTAWERLGAFLEARGAELALPRLDYRDTLVRVGELLESELDLAAEQANLARARAELARCQAVAVPALLPLCTPRLTAMEYLPGEKLRAADGGHGHALARTLVRALLATPLWGEGLFHGDPHAGNLLLMPDGRIGLLDWALGVNLSKDQRAQLVQLALAALTRDGPGLRRAIAALATRLDPDDERLAATVGAWLAHGAGDPLDPERLLGLLDAVAQRAEPGFPEELLILRKAVHTLLGVLDDLAPRRLLTETVVLSALATLTREWPWRLWLPPHSRALPSHLSSWDLVRAASILPALSQDYWRQIGGEQRRDPRGSETCGSN